jgi:hypothetical protein
MRRRALICSALFAALPALGQDRDGLVGLINAYRAAPGTCIGRQATSVAPLTPHPALSSVRVDTGAFLEQALERGISGGARRSHFHLRRAGYQVGDDRDRAKVLQDAFEHAIFRCGRATDWR